jgi:hypothetical protein
MKASREKLKKVLKTTTRTIICRTTTTTTTTTTITKTKVAQIELETLDKKDTEEVINLFPLLSYLTAIETRLRKVHAKAI